MNGGTQLYPQENTAILFDAENPVPL